MSCAGPVYADAPVKINWSIGMYYLNTKREDLTYTFESLARGGKRMGYSKKALS